MQIMSYGRYGLLRMIFARMDGCNTALVGSLRSIVSPLQPAQDWRLQRFSSWAYCYVTTLVRRLWICISYHMPAGASSSYL